MRKLLAAVALTLPTLATAGWISVPPALIRFDGKSGDVMFGPRVVQGGCFSNDFYVIRAASNARTALDVLLAAKSLNRNVQIYIDDAAPCDPLYQRPVFTQVMIEDP